MFLFMNKYGSWKTKLLPIQMDMYTVKHFFFAWQYFREATTGIYLRDFILAICLILFYKLFIRNWRGLYSSISMLLRIYAKIKTSPLKSILQCHLFFPYITHSILIKCFLNFFKFKTFTGIFSWDIKTVAPKDSHIDIGFTRNNYSI